MQFLDLTASAKYFIKCLGDVDGWWVKALCILMNAALPTCVKCRQTFDFGILGFDFGTLGLLSQSCRSQSPWGGNEGKNLLLQTVVGEENFSWTACRAWVICERQTNWRTVLPNTLFWEVPLPGRKLTPCILDLMLGQIFVLFEEQNILLLNWWKCFSSTFCPSQCCTILRNIY